MKKEETFIDKLMVASKIKIKHNGKTVIIPRSALRQARDLAFKLVCHDEHCTKQDILKNPKKYEGKVEGAFRGYLEGYAESVIPAANPGGRHRARAAVTAYQSLTDKNAYWRSKFPSESDEKREQRALVFKSAVMKVSDTFLEGNMKIPTATIGDGKDIPNDKIGLNRTLDMSKPAVQKVLLNQYAQLLSVTWTLALMERLLAVNGNLVKNFITQRVGNKTIAELQEKKTAEAFVSEMKLKTQALLADIDLEKILR